MNGQPLATFLSITFAILMAGCSSVTTSSNLVKQNVYQISAYGTLESTREQLLDTALSKAADQCGHRRFQQIGTAILGKKQTFSKELGRTIQTPQLIIKVDCQPQGSSE